MKLIKILRRMKSNMNSSDPAITMTGQANR